jgi:hypothetical protein
MWHFRVFGTSDERDFNSQLPENAKLQKETVLSLVKGSTVFINYLGAWKNHCVKVVGLIHRLQLRRE